jgi:hypothetical protein
MEKHPILLAVNGVNKSFFEHGCKLPASALRSNDKLLNLWRPEDLHHLECCKQSPHHLVLPQSPKIEDVVAFPV